jgi:hypothetical protein
LKLKYFSLAFLVSFPFFSMKKPHKRQSILLFTNRAEKWRESVGFRSKHVSSPSKDNKGSVKKKQTSKEEPMKHSHVSWKELPSQARPSISIVDDT